MSVRIGPPAYWWPIDDPEEWYCSEGHSCEDGWRVIPSHEPGHADTAFRCPCVTANMAKRRAQRADDQRAAEGRHEAIQRDSYARGEGW